MYPRCIWFPANDFTVVSSLSDFDLSRNTSLRCLEVLTGPIHVALENGLQNNASILLRYALSTMRNTGVLRVTVVYTLCNFCGTQIQNHSSRLDPLGVSPLGKEEEASRHRRVFQLLRDAHRIRDFRLQLYADVWDPIGEYAVRTFNERGCGSIESVRIV